MQLLSGNLISTSVSQRNTKGKKTSPCTSQGIRRGADIRIRIQRRFLCRFIRPAAQGIRPGSPRKNETGREETSIIKLYIFELQQTEKTASSRKFRPLARFEKIARIGVKSVFTLRRRLKNFIQPICRPRNFRHNFKKTLHYFAGGGISLYLQRLTNTIHYYEEIFAFPCSHGNYGPCGMRQR